MAPKTKSRFVYQERDPDEVRKIARDSGKKYETPFKSGFDVFTPKIDTNNIRILPPTWPNAKHYGYFIYVHRFVGVGSGTFLCPQHMGRGKCPCCEAWKAAKEAGDEQEARGMVYSVQAVYWIIDRNSDSDTPQLYAISKVRDQELIELSEDPQTRKLLRIDHPEEGYDISFRRTGKTKLDTKYIGTQIARKASLIHPDEDIQQNILDYITEHPIPSILLFRDYNYINAAISGTAEEKDEDLDTPEDKPWEEAKTARRLKAKPEPEDKEEEEEEKEEKEEAAPSRAFRGRRPDPEEKDEDEDEDEEDNIPQSRKSGRVERSTRRA
jgi:hypothetical protein